MTSHQYNESVSQYADDLYRLALRTLNDVQSAEDMVQEVFMKVWERRTTVDYDKVRGFLFTIMYRTCMDHIRKTKLRKTEEITETMHTKILQSPQRLDMKEDLRITLNALPEQYRMLLLLRDYEGYSYDEISRMTELSLSQVKVYLFRARKKAKKHLLSINIK